jgi:hypothetical protein
MGKDVTKPSNFDRKTGRMRVYPVSSIPRTSLMSPDQRDEPTGHSVAPSSESDGLVETLDERAVVRMEKKSAKEAESLMRSLLSVDQRDMIRGSARPLVNAAHILNALRYRTGTTTNRASFDRVVEALVCRNLMNRRLNSYPSLRRHG